MKNIQCVVILLELSLTLKCFVSCMDTSSPEKYLLPRNYNPHPYQKTESGDDDAGQNPSRYLQRLVGRYDQVFGRKGPVIFPNIGIPRPRNPLVVTSRPLLESIAKSDQSGSILTPKPPTVIENIQRLAAEDYQNTVVNNDVSSVNGYYQNDPNYQNNIAGQTYSGYLNQIFGARTNPILSKYLNVNSPASPTATSETDYQDSIYGRLVLPANGNANPVQIVYPILRNHTYLDRNQYADLARKSQLLGNQGRPSYETVEQQTPVPPIYESLGRYGNDKIVKIVRKAKLSQTWRDQETNTVENTPENEDDDEDNGDYYNDDTENEDKQYAFSYSVKDQETGDDFSHSQHHVGSATKGEYRVKLPDGRMQIVSYTADNGGYKADVRYEEDPEAADPKNNERADINANYQRNHQQNIDYRKKYVPHKAVTLGRIVVPSNEDTDYQDVDYNYNNNYNDISSTKSPYIYVTPNVKEVLITSKPGYLYTPSSTAATPANLVYNQYIRSRYVPNVTPTPKTYLFGSSTTYSPLAQGSDQHNVYSTTTNNPQEASKTYSHFYNAESVKFVSTTPQYKNYKGQALYKSTTRIPPKAKDGDHLSNAGNYLSTAIPQLHKYDHLDSPDVVKIEPRPKSTVNYTTLAPLILNSILANSVTPTTQRPEGIRSVVGSTKTSINPTESARGAGNFGGLDIRKYFTFTKR